jgi:histidine triad (HIT) family protein
VKGEIHSVKIWEDSEFIAFADIKPAGEGHTILIPKKHFTTFMDIDKQTSQDYVGAIKKTGKVLMKKFNADGFNCVLNNGESAGQMIQHVHFHLLPRKIGDNQKGIYIG